MNIFVEIKMMKMKKAFDISTVFWILLILTVVILSGLRVLNLANSVLIALISTTTANIFGFYIRGCKIPFQ